MYKEPESPPVSASVLLSDLLHIAAAQGFTPMLFLFSLTPPHTLLLRLDNMKPEEAEWATRFMLDARPLA